MAMLNNQRVSLVPLFIKPRSHQGNSASALKRGWKSPAVNEASNGQISEVFWWMFNCDVSVPEGNQVINMFLSIKFCLVNHPIIHMKHPYSMVSNMWFYPQQQNMVSGGCLFFFTRDGINSQEILRW